MRHLLELAGVGLLIILWVGSPVRAQSGYDVFGSGRTSALGYASTALTTTAGVQSNPAASAAHERRLVSLYVREGFGLRALRYGAGYVTLPLEWGVISTGASTFGTDAYREVHYSLGFARSLKLGTSRVVHVGIRGRYYHTSIEKYGHAATIGLHVGLQVRILSSLHAGIHATNVNAPSLSAEETLPQTLAVGFQYRATSRVRIVADVFKDVHFPASIRGGIEVRPVPMLALRAGITTAPTRFTGGVGVHIGRFRVHLSSEQHPELGWTPSASIEVHW